MNWGCCPEAHSRVQVVHTQAAGLAVGVGDARFHANAVAHLEVFDVAAHLDNGAGGFVAKHHGRAHHKLADGPVCIVVDVASANAHGVHLDAHIVRAHGFIFVQVHVAQRQLVLAFQYKRFHLPTSSYAKSEIVCGQFDS